MVTDSKSDPIEINPAEAKASLTAEKDPKLCMSQYENVYM